MFMFTFHLCGWERCFFFLFDLLSFLAKQGMTPKRDKLQVISKETPGAARWTAAFVGEVGDLVYGRANGPTSTFRFLCLFLVRGKKRMENGPEFFE